MNFYELCVPIPYPTLTTAAWWMVACFFCFFANCIAVLVLDGARIFRKRRGSVFLDSQVVFYAAPFLTLLLMYRLATDALVFFVKQTPAIVHCWANDRSTS